MAQQATSLDALASMMKLFQGTQTKTKTSGGSVTETAGKQLDQNAMAALLKQALESNQGLAATAQGQKGAGLYNSSTNRLLTNDLLSRLTAQTAIAGAPTVTTRTQAPTTQVQSAPGMSGNDNMTKAMMALTAYNKLGGVQGIKKGATDIYDEISDFFNASASTSAATDFSPVWNAAQNDFTQPVFSANSQLSSMVTSPSFAQTGQGLTDFMFSQEPIVSSGPVVSGGDMGGDAGNFPLASGTSSASSSSGNQTASEVLSEAPSKSDTTSVSQPSQVRVNASGALGGVYSLFSGISALSDDNKANDIQGAVNTASGAYSTYKAGSALASGADINWGGAANSGSALGYVGSIASAFNAPEAAHGKDYRYAVGSAVLNYFGWGWASGIVDRIARPALDASMEAGTESLGYFGAVLADPVGAPLSGQFDQEKLVLSTLDPGNIFGGNPGGSVGKLAASFIDPVGAALGDKGVFSVVSKAIDKIETKDPIGNAIGKVLGQGKGGGGLPGPGRVVCTELTEQGKIPYEKYLQVLKPGVTLTGRVLLGYHVLGIPAVRRLRNDPKFVDRALPYVNAYLDFKLGKFNWTGAIIKYLGEPLCWCLSFFNKDPDAYKVLYPYRRVKNVS